jgi:hypothetical protein
MLKKVHQFFNKPSVKGHLNLGMIACSDIANRPAYFLAHCLLWMGNQPAKGSKCASVNRLLRFSVVAGEDVA